MATASILLEWLFRIRRRQQWMAPSTSTNNSTTRDRIMVQLLLWLTASLPSSKTSFTGQLRDDPRRIFDLLWNWLLFANLLGIVLPQLVQGILPGNRQSWSVLGRRRGNNTFGSSRRATRRGTLLGSMCGGCSRCWGCYGGANATRSGNQESTQRVVLFIIGKCCQDGLELAPLALWVALLRAFVLIGSSNGNPINGKDQSYFGIVGAVWVGSCCGLWLKRLYDYYYKTRQPDSTLEHGYRDLEQSLPGHSSDPSPFTSTIHHSGANGNTHDASAWLDESKWHTWTVSEVREWLLEHGAPKHNISTTAAFSRYGTTYDTHSSVSWETSFHESVVPRLAWEGVDGVALEFLDLDALRHMDVPYGVAAPLLQQIKVRLVQRYPRRHEASNNNYDNDRGWTLEDPCHEHASHSRQSQQQQDYNSSSLFGSSNKNYSISEPPLEEDQLEQMRTVVQQRFGFELPELASADPSQAPVNSNRNDIGESFQIKTIVQHTPKMSVIETASDDMESVDNTEGDSAPPTSMLALMPPHIREIVQEKPHLWQQVQSIQQQSRQPANGTNAATAEESINETIPVHPHVPTPPPLKIAPELLENLPPRVKEVALRNPEVFLQLLQSKQQKQQQGRAGQEGSMVQSKDSFNDNSLAGIAEEELEEENDELVQLLPKHSNSNDNQGLLRQRPGF